MYGDAAALAVLLDLSSWIHRRVERVQLAGSQRLHRALLLDIEIPWDRLDEASENARGTAPVPVLLSDGAARHAGTDVRDDHERVLPIYSRNEAITLVAAVLAREDHALIQGQDASALRHVLRSYVCDDGEVVDTAQGQSGRSLDLAYLVRALVDERLLIVDVPRAETARQIIRVEWDEVIVAATRGLQFPAWRGMRVRARTASDAWHDLVIDPPAGFTADGARRPSPSTDFGAREPWTRASDGWRARRLEPIAREEREVVLTLRPTRRSGFDLLLAALAVLGLSVGLLATGPLADARFEVVPLLLIIPALVSGLVLRSEALLSYIGWGTSALLVTITGFTASVALALDATAPVMSALLALATLAAAAAVAVGVAALTRPFDDGAVSLRLPPSSSDCGGRLWQRVWTS